MIYIVEGCDGTGKTTLAATLSRRHNMPIIHFDRPRTVEEFDDMFDMYIDFLQSNDNVILDRCWYSERVYGPLLRGKEAITLNQQHMLEHLVIEKGGQVCYCYDNLKTITERINKRGDDHIKLEHIPNLLIGYAMVMSQIDPGLPVVHYKVPEVSTNGAK
jgi:thymidylate kinase